MRDMDLKLRAKVALVTGSTSRAGTSIARMLARESTKVIVHRLNREAGDESVRGIEAEGGTARAVVADLLSDADGAMDAQPFQLWAGPAGE